MLVVDDAPANIDVLHQILGNDYRMRAATDGERALKIVQSDNPPDLVLLDVMMPGMNGYEVCQAMQADPRTRAIPVLFVTAADDSREEERGFAAGGVDYITKPVVPSLVRARVALQFQLLDARRSLETRYNELKSLEAMRDSLIHMIVHDLRSPLGSAYSLLDAALEAGGLPADAQKHVSGARATIAEVAERAKAILDVARLESGQMELQLAESNLRTVAQAAVTAVEGLARRHTIALAVDDNLQPVVVDPIAIERVLVNLLSNALKYAPRGSTVDVTVRQAGGRTRLTVADKGSGVPEAYRERIFEKFGQVSHESRHSTGLGLTFCKLAVEAHGGRIGVDCPPGGGSVFWIELPAA
ncbi:MAG: ATP-binding protein [Planctomycetota bacterium]